MELEVHGRVDRFGEGSGARAIPTGSEVALPVSDNAVAQNEGRGQPPLVTNHFYISLYFTTPQDFAAGAGSLFSTLNRLSGGYAQPPAISSGPGTSGSQVPMQSPRGSKRSSRGPPNAEPGNGNVQMDSSDSTSSDSSSCGTHTSDEEDEEEANSQPSAGMCPKCELRVPTVLLGCLHLFCMPCILKTQRKKVCPLQDCKKRFRTWKELARRKPKKIGSRAAISSMAASFPQGTLTNPRAITEGPTMREDNAEDGVDMAECFICRDNVAFCLLQCGHLYCQTCLLHLMEKELNCSHCDSPFEGWQELDL